MTGLSTAADGAASGGDGDAPRASRPFSNRQNDRYQNVFF
jgi:hypothetical protein